MVPQAGNTLAIKKYKKNFKCFLQVLPPSEIGLFLVLPRTARVIPPRPSCICSLGAPSLQWLCWKWLEEYDGDRSSSGDLAQGFGNMEFFRPGRDITENHLLMTRISKSCVVTWITKVRARTHIWCSGSGVLFLHQSGSVLLTGLCVYTHMYVSKCFWKQFIQYHLGTSQETWCDEGMEDVMLSKAI